ncbi:MULTISPECIES: Pycsar system effector family protein [Gordonia]|uniref:Pycsar system effector family protein n=1 Tax=Gordonia TaxID=2053 RepID=UPI0030FF1CCA
MAIEPQNNSDETTHSDAQAVDTAWRVHSALLTWTSSVDQKASFVLAIDGAFLGIAAAVVSQDGRLAPSGPISVLLLSLSVALAVVAGGYSLAAIKPNLKTIVDSRIDSGHFIYFGHLKMMDAMRIRSALTREDILGALTNQLKEMSEICWNKHRRVQRAIECLRWAALGACFYVGVTLLL